MSKFPWEKFVRAQKPLHKLRAHSSDLNSPTQNTVFGIHRLGIFELRVSPEQSNICFQAYCFTLSQKSLIKLEKKCWETGPQYHPNIINGQLLQRLMVIEFFHISILIFSKPQTAFTVKRIHSNQFKMPVMCMCENITIIRGRKMFNEMGKIKFKAIL